MASLIAKFSKHGPEFIESFAKKLGYTTAEDAEKSMGPAAFGRAADKEAEAGPRESVDFQEPNRERYQESEQVNPDQNMVPIGKETAADRYRLDQQQRDAIRQAFQKDRESAVNSRNKEARTTPSLSEEYQTDLPEYSEGSWSDLGKKVAAGASVLGLGAGAAAVNLPSEYQTGTLSEDSRKEGPKQGATSEQAGPPDSLAQRVNATEPTELRSHTESPEQADTTDAAIQDAQDSVDNLASAVNRSPVTSRTVGGVRPGGYTPPSQPSTQAIDDLTKKLTELRKTQIPGDTVDWDKKIADAQTMKEEGASRAAWANLAQVVGESLVQIAAARDAAKHGIVPAAIKGGPPVYEQLMHANEQNYHDQIDAINHSHQYTYQQRQEKIGQAERQYDDDRKSIEDQLGAAKFKYGEDVRQVERGQDRAERERMHHESLAAARENADTRAGAAEASAAHRDSETERKAQLGEVTAKYKNLQTRKKATTELLSLLQHYDDEKSKDQKGMRSRIDKLAGAAGIGDVDNLQSDDVDVETKQAMVGDYLGQYNSTEKNLTEKARALQTPAPRTPPRGSAQSGTTPPTPRDNGVGGGAGTANRPTKLLSRAQVQNYAQHFHGDVAAAEKYLTDQGYTIGN